MSIPERIYRISKSYIGQVRDNIDAKLAEKELDAAEYEAEHPDRDDHSPDAMMRRAEQRIANARRELEERNRAALEAHGTDAPGRDTPQPSAGNATSLTIPTTTTPTTAPDPNAEEFRMLGVPAGSDFPVVQAAYENLARRCDPTRFPAGSGEQKQAQAILEKVNNAYEALRKRLDPMQNRFGKLEFE